VTLGVAAAAFPAVSAAAALVPIGGSQPRFAQSRTSAQAVGSQPLTFTIYLRLQRLPAARLLAYALANPRDHRYHHYLSNQAFIRTFAPTLSQVLAVERWIRSQGLRVTGVAPNRTYVTGAGTINSVGTAFRTRLRIYRVGSLRLRAASSPLMAPPAVASLVVAVGGVSQSGVVHPMDAPSPGFRTPAPCSAFFGQLPAAALPVAFGTPLAYAPCGYTPAQLQSAYSTAGLIAHGVDGRGQTVAFVDAYDSPTLRHDMHVYSAHHGLPPAAYTDISPATLARTVQSSDCGDWYGEQTLDAEAIHAMAPRARIVYSGATSCFDDGLLPALHVIVDTNRAQIISNSWGDAGEASDPTLLAAYDQLFVQAALKGIGIYFASGDNGDEVDTIGVRQPDFPADDPLVTAVGGTSLAIDATNHYQFETGWGTAVATLTPDAAGWTPVPPGTHLYGGGGGTSRVYPEPWYQRGVVPTRLARYFGGGGFAAGGRVVPDVSIDGDPTTGMLVGQTQRFPNGVYYDEYRVGGTSLSSPLFAGLMALADQAAGFRHGFVNPALYANAATGAFRDVTSPVGIISAVRNDFANQVDATQGTATTLRTFNQTESLHATPGFDDATGIGSPIGNVLVARLAHPSH
jgi:subtilase family serine protease